MKECICTDCGDAIEKQRVRLVTNVTRCFCCQEEFESDGKFQRHKMQYHIRFKCDEIESIESEIVRARA